ncbi:MAG: cysteine-rich CWC family protein [Gammaproteobacteria bacterium]|uniref:cysteine-rich CWC family protein n=1 Tax=Rhodoferax sp. TaxID=50421 RepID=UPI001846DA5E|nr:cysteine-rich CWC family protein [Rhodoferax sp.]MBU3900277.1 cysteine-rich CWC family protein [Gammaproteobacteria bacterium]MBA3057194.1 cysteine-rich CWC family protein [Rhodoferax sp.]MBU3997937.1 cysteine-rich CWC family protein [Gammaproteobacteria bacterium]MBU4079385.1 cysteine-rich CWC family protein [Gammaproteobacteria bacterium]MBU4111791.1 cysteine-rich CWC family protein [Gammaproteobacteria bacterium]
MQETRPIDPTRCPLCGQSNQCAGQRERMTGIAQPPCWCSQVTFGAQLLARVPEHARHQACICADCAQAGAS